MKLQAATHVLLSLSVLSSCASREFPHTSDNHGTNWYTNILMRDTKAVSLPSKQFPNDAISAGYCMGCTTWPSPSSSMALALSNSNEPVEQQLKSELPDISSKPHTSKSHRHSDEPVEQQLNLELPDISNKPHASKLHRLIDSQHEKKSTPASYEETCHRQQLILTLVLLGVAAFAFSSKPAKETNAAKSSLAEESDVDLVIELDSTEEECENFIEDTSSTEYGAGVDRKDNDNSHTSSDDTLTSAGYDQGFSSTSLNPAKTVPDANSHTSRDEALATTESDEGVQNTSSSPSSDVPLKTRSIFHEISPTVLNKWENEHRHAKVASDVNGEYSKEKGNKMLNSFEGFLVEVRHRLH